MLVVDFAQLITEPLSVVASVAEFLDLPDPQTEPGLEQRKFNRHASHKVFRLNPESRKALRDVFYPHNEKLRAPTGVDINQHL